MDVQEAALVALGGVLQWEAKRRSGRESNLYALRDRDCAYIIFTAKKWLPPFRRVYEIRIETALGDAEERCPQTFRQQADARAACERHFAFGKWQGRVAARGNRSGRPCV